jgi:precorrin-6B methylase 2
MRLAKVSTAASLKPQEVKMRSSELPLHEQMMKMIVAKWISKPIHIAAELGIADLLIRGGKPIDVLAKESGAHGPTLYRIMRALASVGIFCETDERFFELTPLAQYLTADAMGPFAVLFNAPWNDRAWMHLSECVRNGETPFEKAYGEPLFRWLDHHPDAARVHNEANARKASRTHRAIVDHYDFSSFQVLTDVGGGLGALMIEILNANPHLHGIVAELSAVVPEAQKEIARIGLSQRCQVVACDFFSAVPAESDAYILSNILHDWSDGDCINILKNCHHTMRPGQTLLVVEMVVPGANEPSMAKLLDLEMLVMTGGRERSASEFEELLVSAGFVLSAIIPVEGELCIIEAARR